MDGVVRGAGSLVAVEGKTKVGVNARLELRHGNEAPREISTWKMAKGGVATNVAEVQVQRGDMLDFVAFPAGKTAEAFNWAPSVHMLNVPGDMPEKHDWDAHSEFAGPPPPAPKGMTVWEKYAQALLLTNELVYVN
jgi:hypothetical protein